MTGWLEQHKGRIRPSTYQQYGDSLRNWITPYLGMVRLSALTHRNIESMHDAAIQAGRTPATVRRNHAPLRMALQDAVRDGIIPSNPAQLVRLPPEHRANIEPFTAQEAAMFLAANEGRQLYPIYHLALHSGLRLGEIMALRVGRDIDLFRGFIHVRETRRNSATGPPKSRESLRRVTISPTAVEVLARVIADKSWGELAFPHSPGYVSHSIATACLQAGVKRIRFHDFRHTHATALITAGQNIRAVSARLGHATPSFTLQVYGHVMPGQDEDLAKAAESLFNLEAIKLLSSTTKNGGANSPGTA